MTAIMRVSPYVFPGLYQSATRTSLDIEKLRHLLCNEFQINNSDLNSKTRKSEVVNARQFFSVICLIKTDWSLKTIGRLLGGRDHSTIIHHKVQFLDLCFSSEDYMDRATEFLKMYNLKPEDVGKIKYNKRQLIN